MTMTVFRGVFFAAMLVTCNSYDYRAPEETGAASFYYNYEGGRANSRTYQINKAWQFFFPQSSENNFKTKTFPDTLYDSFESNEIINFEDETQAAESGEKKVFTYDERDEFGPSNWGHINRDCYGNRQSPVNINTNTARYARRYRPLKFDGFTRRPRNITISNNGHGAMLRFGFTKPVRLFGGPLNVPYILDNVHWHWGAFDGAGSEHTINNMRYSAEMHLVAYNSKYNNIKEATNQPKGLAVLAFLYELDNTGGATYNPFMSLLSEVIEPESQYDETRNIFGVSDLIMTDKFNFFNYEGSLTTPSCSETVTWLVSTTTLPISSNEIAQFRRIKDEYGQPLSENFRPAQPINSRTIAYY